MRIPSLSVRLAALWLGSFGGLFAQTAVAEVKHFVRYQHNGEVRIEGMATVENVIRQ